MFGILASHIFSCHFFDFNLSLVCGRVFVCLMYRTRGRPEDVWNVEASEKEKSLAGTIHIRQLQKVPLQKTGKLSNGPSDKEERDRYRHHFTDFKQTYQQRFQQSKEDGKAIKAHMNQKVGEWMDKKRSNFAGYNVQQSNLCDRNPNLQKTPSKGIKTISIDVPNPFLKQAIYTPLNYQNNLLNKLRAQEKVTVSAPSNNVLKQLEDTQEQIELANTQLEEIHKILNHNKSVEVQVDSDHKSLGCKYFRSKTKKTSSSKPGGQETQNKLKNGDNNDDSLKLKVQTKVIPENKDLSRKSSTKIIKKTKVVQTLNNVNSMIQKMQEKYFGKPRTRFKSIKEYGPKSSDKLVSVLYENGKFPEKFSQKTLSDSDNTDNIYAFPTPTSSTKQQSDNSDISKESRSTFSSKFIKGIDKKITEAKYGLGNESPKLKVVTQFPIDITDGSSTTTKFEKLYQDSSSVNIILPPKSGKQGAKIKVSQKPKYVMTTDVGTEIEEDNIKDSIKKSAFLMKEFKVSKHSYHTFQSPGQKKSVRFSHTEFPEEKEKNKNEQQINSFIDSALKKSLYET